MFSEPFWEYSNSLAWVNVVIYIEKFLVSLYQCVLETLVEIF